jgi:hypothetical protein
MNRLQRIYAINLLIDHAYLSDKQVLRQLCHMLNISTVDMLFEDMAQAAFDILTEDLGVKDEYK